MRFAVASSTVSGLLVVLITAAVGRVFRSWLSWHVVLPLLLAAGWALAALPLVLRVRRRDREPKRVFLIVAAFTCKHWVAQLIGDLHENLERRGCWKRCSGKRQSPNAPAFPWKSSPMTDLMRWVTGEKPPSVRASGWRG